MKILIEIQLLWCVLSRKREATACRLRLLKRGEIKASRINMYPREIYTRKILQYHVKKFESQKTL